jgi:hypothetical protein
MRDGRRRFLWEVFLIGLGVRLLGVALLLLGDGHSTLLAKATVIVGVILTVGGIAILRWLLFQSLFRKKKFS